MEEPGSAQALAAYLYVLGLDDLAMAWEYLRRNPDYHHDWAKRDERALARWMLNAFEDPGLDARTAHPLWAIDPPLQLVPVPDDPEAPRLDLWKCGCDWHLTHDGRLLRATVLAATPTVRLALCPRLGDGECYAYRLPAGGGASAARRAALDTAALHEQPACPAAVRPARRAVLVSMHTLAVMDALACGASERDMGVLLFGCGRVAAEWSAESALRAQVRHLVKRGRQFVAGGYRKLLGTGDLRR